MHERLKNTSLEFLCFIGLKNKFRVVTHLTTVQVIKVVQSSCSKSGKGIICVLKQHCKNISSIQPFSVPVCPIGSQIETTHKL